MKSIFQLLPLLFIFVFSRPLCAITDEEELLLMLRIRSAVQQEILEKKSEDPDQTLAGTVEKMLSSKVVGEIEFAKKMIANSEVYFAYLAAQGDHRKIIAEIARCNWQVLGLPNDWGQTPAHLAAQAGHLEILQVIVRYHREIFQTQDQQGATPAYYAAKQGHLRVVTYIYQHDRNSILQADYYGQTALHSAAKRGHLPVVKFFADHLPTMFKFRDQWGHVPGQTAYLSNRRNVVEFLTRSLHFRKFYL